MAKLMSTKQYVNCLIDEYNKKTEIKSNVDRLNDRYISQTNQAINEAALDVVNRQNTAESRMAKYRRFVTESKTALLSECIYRLYDACMAKPKITPNLEGVCRSIVNNFVAESSTEDLLRRFRTGSEMLSEMSYLVDKYHALVLESVDKDNEETFKVSANLTDKFYEELDCVNADEVIFSIRNRVMDATNDFIDKNTEDKANIKEILKDTKEKIDTIKDIASDDIQESYSINAKKKITNIRNNRPKSVFESMVTNLLRKSYVNEEYKNVYFEGSNVNMDKIVENCEIIYTFLEMVNTSKMVTVNEEYIQNILDDMK